MLGLFFMLTPLLGIATKVGSLSNWLYRLSPLQNIQNGFTALVNGVQISWVSYLILIVLLVLGVVLNLFLPIKAEREKEVNQSKARVVNEAKNDVFRTEQNAKTLAVDKKVRPFLFKETATVTSPESVESLEVQREISINFWLYSGIFLGSIVILFVGVFLGNRFSYHRAQSGN